jgi:aromatic-amino-acid transaminase
MMLEALTPQPQDKILVLMAQFREDLRTTKIDLGVGVYKDATGLTPVMRAVKTAEKQLWERELTKTYTGLAGEPAFNAAMSNLILGPGFADRAASAATPGGTGALHQALELIKMASPNATVWISNPTWPNHPSIIRYLGLNMAEYRYCHNPTGANLTADQWSKVADVLSNRGAIPFVDLAYQGFGDGLEADAEATRMIASRFPEVLIAASCSKNFGIYRERTGVLIALGEPSRKAVVQANLAYLNRQNFSFPPDHGARLVTMILEDPALSADWKAELEEVRLNMLTLRQSLAEELRRATNSDRYDFVAHHRGMFSRLGISEAQVNQLRDTHAVYMVGDSRINIAGLNARTVPILAQAIAAVGG